MVLLSGASSGASFSAEARPEFICITIQVGIGGSRNLELVVRQQDVLLDVAERIQQSFSPEYDNHDIMLVHGTKKIGLISIIADIELSSGSVFQAVIIPQHPIAIRNSCMDTYPCDCKLFWCRCFGRNFVFNLDTLAPLIDFGKKTLIKTFYDAMRVSTWNTDCNHGNMSMNELSRLCQAAADEVLWNCIRCRKLAICRTDSCVPVDEHQQQWRFSLDGLAFCGTCVATRPGIAVDAVEACRFTVRTPPLLPIPLPVHRDAQLETS